MARPRTIGRWRNAALALSVASVLLYAARAEADDALRFVVQLDPALATPDGAEAGYTGRVLVYLSQRQGVRPIDGPRWVETEPFYRVDVTGLRPGETCVVDGNCPGFPTPLSELPPGFYNVQALFDHTIGPQHPAKGAGNFFSRMEQVHLDPAEPQEVRLLLNDVVRGATLPERDWLRAVRFISPLLSEFHRRRVVEHAAVVLPEGYDDHPDRRYPTIYVVPGFGGSELDAAKHPRPPVAGAGEVDFIRVYLSGNCEWGHHVYADSATNGPRGQALVEELIPYIDAHFRTDARPEARFLNGHSSGGWSVLWLQVNYPEAFGGAWSTSPDPVDFRAFQTADIYAETAQSMYRLADGSPRPLSRRGSQVMNTIEDFVLMEEVLGHGGQFRSFEAVFSPRDADGTPRRLFDRRSGLVDHVVAEAWQAYDLRRVLERDWSRLGPLLEGKLHIVVGDQDTYYLDEGVRLLDESLQRLGSDARIEYVPGAGHSDVLTPELFARFRREMSAAYLDHGGEPAAE